MYDSTQQLKAALQELSKKENSGSYAASVAVIKKQQLKTLELSGEASAFLEKRAEYLKSVKDISVGDF